MNKRPKQHSSSEPCGDALSASKSVTEASPEQLRKFEEAARALGTDDDPERFKERVRKLALSQGAEPVSATVKKNIER